MSPYRWRMLPTLDEATPLWVRVLESGALYLVSLVVVGAGAFVLVAPERLAPRLATYPWSALLIASAGLQIFFIALYIGFPSRRRAARVGIVVGGAVSMVCLVELWLLVAPALKSALKLA